MPEGGEVRQGGEGSSLRRRLSREHFAFLRGLAQGAEVRGMWLRYMAVEGRFDERLVARTVAWLKDELAATARRSDRHRIARLVAMDLSRVPPDPKQPNLEDFAARFEPGFYSERELLELFADEFPPTRKTNRRGRLIAQQLDALAQLEKVAASDPDLVDPLTSWLPAALADRLGAAGLVTVVDLIDRINGKLRSFTNEPGRALKELDTTWRT